MVFCRDCGGTFEREELGEWTFFIEGKKATVEHCPDCNTYKGLEYPENV